MTRKIIDMTKDPRSGQFEYFRTMTDPWAGITVPVDITDLLASLNGRPFFLSYLYAVMRAANAVPELRRRLLPDGQVVEYDHCDPSYTVMKPDGTGIYVYSKSPPAAQMTAIRASPGENTARKTAA